ncbi:PilZ domain-containing protein [Methylorubrum extorquens]|uniref:PilZ domain-containing protein n=1 Tax=Methylorubrum extorquens TaxID=408 RepID=UPI003CC90D59
MQLARVILPCGKRIICVIRDVSPRGAKINISRRYQLAEAFRLDLIHSKKKFVVECAWRRGDYVGVKLIPVSISETVFR